MSASVERIGAMLHVGDRFAKLIALAGILGVVGVAALLTDRGMLPIAVGAAVLGLAVVVGFRWPLVPLAVFAALIPIEEVVVLEGFGTLSRVAGILFAVTYGAPRLGSLALGAMPPAGWAYLAWAILSSAWAISPDVASAALPTILQLFIIAALVADFVVRRPAIIRPVLWAYSLSATATALIGIQAYLVGGVGTARSVAIQDQDPAQFAAVLLPAVVFGLYEVMDGNHRILGGVIALLTTTGVVVSGTRGAWVACAVVILFIVLPQLTARRRVLVVAIIAIAFAAILQLPGIADLVAERGGNAVSTGGAGRTDIWTVGLAIFDSSPLAGVGYANFPVAFTPETIRQAGVGWDWFDRAGAGSHNLAIATLAELGVIGFMLLVLFLAPLVARRGWGPDAGMVQAALASLITVAFFLDIYANRKQVWLVIGLTAGLAFLDRMERRKVSLGRPVAQPGPTGGLSVPGAVSSSGTGAGWVPASGSAASRPRG